MEYLGLAEYSPSSPTESVGFFQGFIASLTVIVVSEIGDKTFFIAAIMAMGNSRLTVFGGAIFALSLMTVLSAFFGFLTKVIPRVYTYYASTILFAFFGLKMLYDAYKMGDDEGANEMEEVQASLEITSPEDVENPSEKLDESTLKSPKMSSKPRRCLFAIFSRVFLQAFSMTFLAEWGDRSQLATILLAATEDIPGVCIGGIVGHAICTGLAVLGGRLLAQKISVKTVTIIGGCVFLLFAISSLLMNPEI